jgi:arginase
MNNSRFIKLVEVHSDIASAQRGSRKAIQALVKSCKQKGSNYFEKYPAEVILDENHTYKDGTKYNNAKFIDKVTLVIQRVTQRIKELRNQKLFPIIIAADHSTSAGTMAGLKLAHKNEDIGVVYIDAHADLHTPYTTPSGNLHGMPLAIAMSIDNSESKINKVTNEELKYWNNIKGLSGIKPAIKPSNIVFCALRDYEKAELELIEKYNIKNYSTNTITMKGVKEVAKSIFRDLKNCKHIYISFDIDSIDPLYIPGTGTPSKGGLSFEQALCLNMELIKNSKVCCWEIAEINPRLDINNISGNFSFHIIEEVTKELLKNY